MGSGLQVYVDGKIVPAAEATVSVFDAGFQSGDAVWEGLRVYHGTVLRLDDHLTRLEHSAKALLDDLGYDAPFLIEEGHVLTHGLGEQRRYAIQHALGHQIWEADHPHVGVAHGRAYEGYDLTESDQRQLAEARARLAEQARFDDD